MGRIRVGLAALLAATTSTVLLGACSSSGRGSGATSAPELSHIVVDTLPIPDAAPLFIAIRDGYFKRQGLDVKVNIIQGSPQANQGLATAARNAAAPGAVDFTTVNYVSTFVTQEDPHSAVQFRIVSPELSGAPNVMVLMVPRNSPITSLSQLKGKTIAAPEQSDGIGQLAVAATLQPYGISLNQVKFKQMGFPQMGAALAEGKVDAAWVNQPFVTVDEAQYGEDVLADTLSGTMANFPVSGWATTPQFAQKYPKTVAAFQRALAQGQQLAATDRHLVERILPTYSKTSTEIAEVMSLGSYPTSLTSTQLQRVASLMLQFHLLTKPLNAASMIERPAPS